MDPCSGTQTSAPQGLGIYLRRALPPPSHQRMFRTSYPPLSQPPALLTPVLMLASWERVVVFFLNKESIFCFDLF